MTGSCPAGEEKPGPGKARPPAVAGSLYPGTPDDITAMIEAFLAETIKGSGRRIAKNNSPRLTRNTP